MPTRVADSLQWHQCMRKSLRERVEPAKFEILAKALKKHPIPPDQICEALLDDEGLGAVTVDPLLGRYAEVLIALGCVQPHDVLGALIRPFEHKAGNEEVNGEGVSSDVLSSETISIASCAETLASLLSSITFAISNYGRPKTSIEARAALEVATTWMRRLCVASEQVMLTQESENLDSAGVVILVCEAFGALFLVLAENPQVRRALDEGLTPDYENQLQSVLHKFTTFLGASSPQVATRLAMLQHSHRALQPRDSPHFDELAGANESMRELQLDSVLHRVLSPSRAGLFVLLGSLIFNNPITSTEDVLKCLKARYRGNLAGMVVDLLIASFDLIDLAVRSDNSRCLFLSQTFLVNKLPLLLSVAASTSFANDSIGFMLAQAVRRMNHAGIGTSDQGGSVIGEAKANFVSACVVQGLIEQGDAQHLSEQKLTHNLPRGRLNKDALVLETQNEASKLARLSDGLLLMDGNVEARALAVTEVFQSLCKARDMMTLKVVCTALLTERAKTDAICLFSGSPSLLDPLTELLDSWTYDSDQVEYHANYNEFSACVALLMVCGGASGSSSSQTGLYGSKSFVKWIMEGLSSLHVPYDASPGQETHLKDWIKGLFDIEGITDEQLSTCPPQDFYRMVPSLFHQIVIACRQKVLSKEKLRNGLELLLEPLLVPSIAFGFQYLIDHMWKVPNDAETVFQIINILAAPSTMQGEAASRHQAILSLYRDRLLALLEDSQSANVSKDQIRTLSDRLNAHSDGRPIHSRVPLDDFPLQYPPSPTLLQQFANSLNALCSWSIPGLMQSLPEWSFQEVRTTIELCGATRVVRITIDVLCSHAQDTTFDIALDVATCLIIADELSGRAAGRESSTSSRMTLRRALGLEREQARMLASKDTRLAEIIVLFHRSVEDQLAFETSSDLQLDMPGAMVRLEVEPSVIEGLGADSAMDADGSALGIKMEVPNLDFEMGDTFDDLHMSIPQDNNASAQQEQHISLTFGASDGEATQGQQGQMSFEQESQDPFDQQQPSIEGFQWDSSFDLGDFATDSQGGGSIGAKDPGQQGDAGTLGGAGDEQNEDDFWNSLTKDLDPGMGF